MCAPARSPTNDDQENGKCNNQHPAQSAQTLNKYTETAFVFHKSDINRTQTATYALRIQCPMGITRTYKLNFVAPTSPLPPRFIRITSLLSFLGAHFRVSAYNALGMRAWFRFVLRWHFQWTLSGEYARNACIVCEMLLIPHSHIRLLVIYHVCVCWRELAQNHPLLIVSDPSTRRPLNALQPSFRPDRRCRASRQLHHQRL